MIYWITFAASSTVAYSINALPLFTFEPSFLGTSISLQENQNHFYRQFNFYTIYPYCAKNFFISSSSAFKGKLFTNIVRISLFKFMISIINSTLIYIISFLIICFWISLVIIFHFLIFRHFLRWIYAINQRFMDMIDLRSNIPISSSSLLIQASSLSFSSSFSSSSSSGLSLKVMPKVPSYKS